MFIAPKNPLITLFTLLVGRNGFGAKGVGTWEKIPLSLIIIRVILSLLLHYDKSNFLQKRSPLVIFLLKFYTVLCFGWMHWCSLRRLLCMLLLHLYGDWKQTNSLLLNLNTEQLLTRLTSVLSIVKKTNTQFYKKSLANYLRIISNYTIYCSGRPKLK